MFEPGSNDLMLANALAMVSCTRSSARSVRCDNETAYLRNSGSAANSSLWLSMSASLRHAQKARQPHAVFGIDDDGDEYASLNDGVEVRNLPVSPRSARCHHGAGPAP